MSHFSNIFLFCLIITVYLYRKKKPGGLTVYISCSSTHPHPIQPTEPLAASAHPCMCLRLLRNPDRKEAINKETPSLAPSFFTWLFECWLALRGRRKPIVCRREAHAQRQAGSELCVYSNLQLNRGRCPHLFFEWEMLRESETGVSAAMLMDSIFKTC